MSQEQKFLEAFKKHVPETAALYCLELWKTKPFHLHITRERQSKLGDFRYRRDRSIQKITINHNLNPYQFLITYIHEVAHYRAFEKYGLNIKAHGPEWKAIFRELMSPMLNDAVFPKDVLLPLKRHMVNPKASSGADLFLSKSIRQHDLQDKSDKHLLADLFPGETFELQGRQFKKDQTRRTRVLCEELGTGRKYLIAAHAEVKKLDQ